MFRGGIESDQGQAARGADGKVSWRSELRPLVEQPALAMSSAGRQTHEPIDHTLTGAPAWFGSWVGQAVALRISDFEARFLRKACSQGSPRLAIGKGEWARAGITNREGAENRLSHSVFGFFQGEAGNVIYLSAHRAGAGNESNCERDGDSKPPSFAAETIARPGFPGIGIAWLLVRDHARHHTLNQIGPESPAA